MKKLILSILISISVFSHISAQTKRYQVGVGGQFATIKECITWLTTNMTGPSELFLGGGSISCTDSVGIALPYSLSIRGLDFQITKLVAATGLLNKPFFNIRSTVSFNRITIDGSTLSTYGDHNLESGINIQKGGALIRASEFKINRCRRGINLTGASTLLAYQGIFANCNRAVEVNSLGAAYADVEMVDIDSCNIGVNLLKATSGQFYFNNILFAAIATDTCINYVPATFTYTNHPSIINCKWNIVGSFTKGFDFTRADGRDRNIVIISNVGIEDKSPHCKVNLAGASSSKSYPAGVWTKVTFTATSSYTCKFTIATDSITYQPNNNRDVMAWINGSISTSTQASIIDIAILKNANRLVPYGTVTLTLDQDSRFFLFGTNVYIPDVAAGDVLSIYIKPVGTETLTIVDLNWLINSR